MTANELADAIRGCGDCSYNEDAYIMLRQQQAEIEALKFGIDAAVAWSEVKHKPVKTYTGGKVNYVQEKK